MVIDWDATAAWIVLGASVISPVVVAIVNNCHQRKMFLLQAREGKRSETISIYLSSLAKAISSPTHEEVAAYCVQYGLVTGYVPPEAIDDVDKMHGLVLDAASAYSISSADSDALQRQYLVVRKHFYKLLTA